MEKDDLLQDLYLVGKTKSLGYLPISTITEDCNSSVEEFTKYALENNLRSVLLQYPEECKIVSGALYLYDTNMLTKHLEKYSNILKMANVPCDDNLTFIRYISNTIIFQAEYPEAYKIIALAFNDKRFVS